MSAVLVPVGRWGGWRYVVPPPAPEPVLSERAAAWGLRTPQDVEAEFRLQHGDSGGNQPGDGFWKGQEYHCPTCDKDFWSPGGARKHMTLHGHRVLRADWLAGAAP